MKDCTVPRRRFGRTELSMPVLTCGGMRFQKSWFDPDSASDAGDSPNGLETLVNHCLDRGINHFETARGYGDSEVQLGTVLPHLPREDILVQTKIAPSASPKQFREAVEQSLDRLKLDYVDLLSLHGVNTKEILEWCVRPKGCLEELLTFQKKGRCRFIGFSTHGNLPIIIEMIETGAMQYINLHWYFVQQVNWPAVQAATIQDMGVFIISPNNKGGMLYEPSEKLRRVCEPLSPMEFNDLWCLSRGEVHTLSIGASCTEDLEEHTEALRHYEERSTVTAPIAKRLESEMRAALGSDWCDRWYVGLPDHQDVPGQINVREILRLWNFAKGLDMVEYGKMRYNLLGNGGHWFPGKSAADFNDRKMAACLRHSPFADRIPDILRDAHALMADQPVKRLTEGG